MLETAKRHGRTVLYYPCDVRDEQAMKAAFAEFVPLLHHPIRGLLACAGLSLNGPSIDFPVDDIRRMFDINAAGTFLVAQLVATEVKKTGLSASMVFVASMSGYVSNKVSSPSRSCVSGPTVAKRVAQGVDTAGYNASKAAVQQLGRSLAAEWGSRVNMPLIRVNTLSPGYIRTEATAESLAKPGMENQWVGDNMLYRLSTADEFRAPVLFLLGDGSSFMTGSDLRVDGGHCAW